MKGIDISEFNGDIDFKKVKESGIEFIYIRATFGRHGIDKRFKEYTNSCIKLNIPFSFYYYSYALNEEEAETEAKFFIKQIAEFRDEVSFPVVIDMEDADSYKKNHNIVEKEALTNITIKGLETLQAEGFLAFVYASYDWFKNKLIEEKLSKFGKWLAIWNEKADFDKDKFHLWQYSSTGKIDGIKGNVDLDESFFDFPELFRGINRINKINYIKIKSGLMDLTMQFLTCYKFGNELIEKIYKRFREDRFLKAETYEEFKKSKFPNKLKLLKKEFNIEDTTVNFLSLYLYGEELINKLILAISEVDNK